MLLDKWILKTDYGVSYGSITLKSLQNDNVPELDLLVREAVQNSSDASLNELGEYYTVNFRTSKFNPASFNDYLTDATEKLNKMYPGGTADYLEIRDKNTSGLTGLIRKSEIRKDDHGNFFKLIYDTGKNQTNPSAGGNWGFGKSVYYRVGCGIVIYYTRIKNGESYEERLIITLIEDENKKDADGNDCTILNSLEEHSAGKAWWGIKDGDDLLPLTDAELIQPVLDIFNIKRFKDDETGTSVIIPYLNTQRLLNEVIPADLGMREDKKNYFEHEYMSDIASYLSLSLQRWYAPKINNLALKNFGEGSKWLRLYVNDIPVSRNTMKPIFRLVQDLYTAALSGTNNSTTFKSTEFSDIDTAQVKVRKWFDNTMSGCVSFIKVSKEEISEGQNVLSPYDYFGKFETDDEINEPVMIFARDPGMVVDYATTGPWVSKINPPENQDEYILAFFVPNTKNRIKENYQVKKYAGMTLGEYLRGCEASDHMAWTDPAEMRIVTSIQNNTGKLVFNTTNNDILTDTTSQPSDLSKKLGKLLLPRFGYGKKKGDDSESHTGSGSGSNPRTLRQGNSVLTVNISEISKNESKIAFTLKTDKQSSNIISLQIASEGGWLSSKQWNIEIGTAYPIQIVDCYMETVKTEEMQIPCRIERSCNADNREVNTSDIHVCLVSDNGDSNFTGLCINTEDQGAEIIGTITLRTYDRKYQFRLLNVYETRGELNG